MFIAKADVIGRRNHLSFLSIRCYHSKGMLNSYPNHTISCMKTNFHLKHVTLCDAAAKKVVAACG